MTDSRVADAELVVHVFVATDGDHADDPYRWLRTLWEATKKDLLLTSKIDPPEEQAAALGHPEPLLGFAEKDHDGEIAQALLRRAHDVLVLSVAVAPDGGTGESWHTLDDRWDGVVKSADPRPGTGVLGTARIYQGKRAALEQDGALPTVAASIRGLVPSPRAEPSWEQAGSLTTSGLAQWETGPVNSAPDRRLVVLGRPGEDATLSAHTWVVGASGTTPFTRYLLQTAKIRHSQAVLHAGADDIRRAYRRVDDETRAVLDTLDSTELNAVEEKEVARLVARCTRISLDLARLDDLRRQLRTLRRTVEIAVANRSRSMPEEMTSGPSLFEEDRVDSDVLLARLDDELEYLDAVRESGREVNAAVHAAADSERQARRDRFTLLQTAVIGVLVMVMTAVQALQYEGPLDHRVYPALIALLGGVALILGVEMLDRAQPADARFGRMGWARAFSVGVCGAATGWLVETLVRVQLLDHPADARLSWSWAGVGFLLATTIFVARHLRTASRVGDGA
jgi:hypothetical protein